jgi:hypothetical protein
MGIVKMKQWVVVGCSYKLDTIFYIVSASDGNEAMNKVAQLHGVKFISVDIDNTWGKTDCFITNDCGETEDDLIQYIKSSFKSGNGPRKFWQISCTEAIMDKDLGDYIGL